MIIIVVIIMIVIPVYHLVQTYCHELECNISSLLTLLLSPVVYLTVLVSVRCTSGDSEYGELCAAV